MQENKDLHWHDTKDSGNPTALNLLDMDSGAERLLNRVDASEIIQTLAEHGLFKAINLLVQDREILVSIQGASSGGDRALVETVFPYFHGGKIILLMRAKFLEGPEKGKTQDIEINYGAENGNWYHFSRPIDRV